MKYETNMQTGERTNIVIEVGDKFVHKQSDQMVTVIRIGKDNLPFAGGYVIKDNLGNEFGLTRAVILRDFRPADEEDIINSWSPEKREYFNKKADELLKKVKEFLGEDPDDSN